MKLNMSFLIKDDKLLEQYNEMLKITLKNNLKKESDSEPLYNKKNLKAKIK